jgi:hypothetical protein
VSVVLTSPDFFPLSQSKNIFVPVNTDSAACPFLLTPLRLGKLVVTIELVWEDAGRGSRFLRTTCVSESELESLSHVVNVVQLPVAVAASAQAAAAAAGGSGGSDSSIIDRYAPGIGPAITPTAAVPGPPPNVPNVLVYESGLQDDTGGSYSSVQGGEEVTRRRVAQLILVLVAIAVPVLMYAGLRLQWPKVPVV